MFYVPYETTSLGFWRTQTVSITKASTALAYRYQACHAKWVIGRSRDCDAGDLVRIQFQEFIQARLALADLA
ncbi:hypothetical protein OUZ56_009783 [Daphnia magna]|uniref:Uncharacterized protein n=1 Tax=Daphnia magna TaxID=35525 RepID=A0ABR0AGX4_9CRUS|nr:hypothetical protein OUZ56_009783 [Daphnia magna]